METNFDPLQDIQRSVNLKVHERLNENNLEAPTAVNFLTAMQVELFELINELGFWKWWKQNHNVNKEKVLDELADVMAFYLEITLIQGKKDTQSTFINTLIEELEQFSKEDVLSWITISIEKGDKMNHPILMGAAITLVIKTLEDVTWEEIQEAYMNKSEVNIERQENNY